MDSLSEGSIDGAPDLNLEWATPANPELNSNSTFLYIAVEYVKGDYKMDVAPNIIAQSDQYNDFDPHVSPLDPNMSSVARYSPVYNEPTPTDETASTSEFNPVVIHQIVPENQQQFNNTYEMPVLCNNIVENPNSNEITQSEDDQVELLITDQVTGISYSVRSSQEFLVERCLDDEQQLLNSLATSDDNLLDTDLLALDENALKTELSDDLINSDYISNLVTNNIKQLETQSNNNVKMETRSSLIKQDDIEFEDHLLSKVYNIVDKPVLSRARATLPELYLIINNVGNEFGVFAKRTIPKRTQFGPLLGIKMKFDSQFKDDCLLYLVEDENCVTYRIDVSNENCSNWMSFVRQAKDYNEQNLLISQEGDSLYFTATKNILVKQELKVGYSLSYANKHKLKYLSEEKEFNWQCFECNDVFETSSDLQKHLNVHDNLNDDNYDNETNNDQYKPKRKLWKNRKKLPMKNPIETQKCNQCSQMFYQSNQFTLKQHLVEKHKFNRNCSCDDNFTVVFNYKCDKCDLIFTNESLLKIHNYLHNNYDSNDDDNDDEQQTNHICTNCQKKFPTQRQLISHVTVHALSNVKIIQPENFKCNVCHKLFALKERLRRHMLVHTSNESKPLQCKQCTKRFVNNSALAGHLKTHFVGKKIFECPICKETFDHVLKLKLHVPKHCENNLFSCPHCTKVFKKYSIIRKHIRAFHCEQKHACPHCTKLFPTLDKLRMHLLRHSDHREFLCSDCGKQFKRKDKLREHCKRMHSEERENDAPKPHKIQTTPQQRKITKKSIPTDFHRFIYKCHTCLVGFKRRGMLVNHLAKRHPDVRPDSVPELNLPILQTTRNYYCQHCDKVYKSSSKRKAHILKNHPGAELPMSNRLLHKNGNFNNNNNANLNNNNSNNQNNGVLNPTFTQTVGSITTRPQNCNWCHKQYASKAKLLQHQRKKHSDKLAGDNDDKNNTGNEMEKEIDPLDIGDADDIIIDENCIEDFKKTDTDLLSEGIEEFDRGLQYYHLVTINGNNDDFSNQTLELSNPNSHLYKLLTTSNGLVPPR